MDLVARLTDDTSEGQGAALGEPPRVSLTLGEAWAATDIHIIALCSFSVQQLIMGTTLSHIPDHVKFCHFEKASDGNFLTSSLLEH